MTRSAIVMSAKILCSMIALASAHADDGKPRVPENLRGKRLLVALGYFASRDPDLSNSDPFNQSAEEKLQQMLKDAKGKKVARYDRVGYGTCMVLDCGDKKPQAILAAMPGHQGAMLFEDGNFRRAFAAKDTKETPRPLAALTWGGGADDIKQMYADIKKYSELPGVAAQTIDLARGEAVFGNSYILKLTPARGKTLLEVFLLAKAEFCYAKLPDE